MAARVCSVHGCPVLGSPPACAAAACPGTRKRRADAARPSAAQRGYGARWQATARGWLRRHRWCVRCGALATVLDHIKPHRGDVQLFWDRRNWQSLCKRCHDSKTATEDTERDALGRWSR